MVPITVKKRKEITRSGRKAGEAALVRSFHLGRPDTIIKVRDNSRCPHCGNMMPKAEDRPDYIVMVDYYYIEVKESDATGVFRPLGEHGFTEIQRKRLWEHEGYVFLVMRDGQGSSAYYMPYEIWLGYEGLLQAVQDKGFRRRSDKRLLGLDDVVDPAYVCQWVSANGPIEGHWQLPDLPRGVPSWLQRS